MEKIYKGLRLTIVKGDLTQQKTDAIVNPANSQGVMGGGVALAIKQAGGEQIEKDAVRLAPIAVGKAIATSKGALPCRYVIHAPTMPTPGVETNAKAVDHAMAGALRLATQMEIKSISFPGMGTGTGKVPIPEAAKTMTLAVKFFMDQYESRTSLKEVVFVAFDEELETAFTESLTLIP